VYADLEVLDFDRFYERELAAVVAVVYALCGNRWAAEDLAHDAFAATYRRWKTIQTYERPGAFVRRVAINLAHSRARRLAAEARALARYTNGQSPSVLPLDPSERDFWNAVRRLPRRQKEVIALRYLEGYSEAEIAAVLGCSEATVRVHVHRAKEALSRTFRFDRGGDD